MGGGRGHSSTAMWNPLEFPPGQERKRADLIPTIHKSYLDSFSQSDAFKYKII